MVWEEFINTTLEMFGYIMVAWLVFVIILLMKKVITRFL